MLGRQPFVCRRRRASGSTDGDAVRLLYLQLGLTHWLWGLFGVNAAVRWRLCLVAWLSAGVFAGLAVADETDSSGAKTTIKTPVWVVAADEAIDQHRKQAVRVVVLDAGGQLVGGAAVSIQQQSHDFAIGCLMPAEGLETLASDHPVWRVFNSVSLEREVSWQQLVADPGAWQEEQRLQVDALLAEARQMGIGVRLGPWVKGDPAQNPDALHGLDTPRHLEQSMNDAETLTRWLGHRVDAIDLYGDRSGRDGFVQRHGIGGLRALFEAARVTAPTAMLSLRYRDGMRGRAAAGLYKSLLEVQQGFVGLDSISLDQQIDGLIVPVALKRDIDRLSRLQTPIDWVNLEVGGNSPEWAEGNLDTVLRLAFAEPSIQGLWFGGMTAEDCLNPHAALLDESGAPTPAGLVLEALFKKEWWGSLEDQTDEQGVIETRLFKGVHELTAVLPGGAEIRQRVRVTGQPEGDVRWIVLQAPRAQ